MGSIAFVFGLPAGSLPGHLADLLYADFLLLTDIINSFHLVRARAFDSIDDRDRLPLSPAYCMVFSVSAVDLRAANQNAPNTRSGISLCPLRVLGATVQA
jgi:hypothetical protein